MTSRLVDRLAVAATAAIFCAAVFVLVYEFASVNPRDVLPRLVTLPPRQIFAAAAFTVASYLLLTGYDFLGLRYTGRHLRLRNLLFASFTAFAFSNNIGFQLLSGGSIRYRIYSRFGLDVIAIGEIVAFCTFTYVLGAITLGGLLALFVPADLASVLHVPRLFLAAAGSVLLGCSVAYLVIAAIWTKPIPIGGYRLRPPGLALAASQVALASIDAVLAGTVIYVLLPADVGVTYQSFLGIYVIAATVAVLSLVPGGLGIFEAAVTVMTTSSSKIAVLDAFLAYRIIYFLLPLVVAIVWLAIHEFRGRAVKQPSGPERRQLTPVRHCPPQGPT